MKKLIILSLITFLFGNAFSQNEHPFADTSKMWSNMMTMYPPGNQQTYFIRFQGDTTISGMDYLKVWKTMDTTLVAWENCGMVRENLTDKTIFYRDLNGNEGLMYDLGMQPGDTITIQNNYWEPAFSLTAICLAFDSIFIGGEYRRKQIMDFAPPVKNTFPPLEYWIDGIGSNRGTLGAGFSGMLGNRLGALCCWENDELIYSVPMNQCTIYGDVCPQIGPHETDTIYTGQYFEYQVPVTSCPSDSIWFFSYNLPDFLQLDTAQGIISGTPPSGSAGTEYFTIHVVNYIYQSDEDVFFFEILNPVGIHPPEAEPQLLTWNIMKDKILWIFRGKDKSLHPSSSTLAIFSASGRKMCIQSVASEEWPVQINVNRWAPGVYFALVYNHVGVAGRVRFVVD